MAICSFHELEKLGSAGGASSSQLQLSGTHCRFTFAPRRSVAVSFEQVSRLIISGCSLSLTFPPRTVKEIELNWTIYFTVESSVDMYRTRTREDLHTSSLITNLGKKSVRYKANKFWNSLLNSLKVITTSKQFKNKLETYLQLAVISRAHSFPRKILPNSAVQLTKFCGSPRQNRHNSMARPQPPIYDWKLKEMFKSYPYQRLALY